MKTSAAWKSPGIFMVTTQSLPAMLWPTPTAEATASFTDQPTLIRSWTSESPLSITSELGVPG